MNNETEITQNCPPNTCHPPAKMVFASPAPYPPVRICERNAMYGRMMLDNMCGQNSEMSAVSLYLYNNLLIDENEKLSNIFREISIVEMHHVHIFSEIARMMGEAPRLWTHRGNQMSYWSPAYNHYAVELKPMLQNARNREKGAVQKYQEQCSQIKDQYIVECLERIIEDEYIHIKIFESLYEEYCV